MTVFSFKDSDFEEVLTSFENLIDEMSEEQRTEFSRQKKVISASTASLAQLYREMNPLKEKSKKVESNRFKVAAGIVIFWMLASYFGGSSLKLALVGAFIYFAFEFEVHRIDKAYQSCRHTELIILKDITSLGVSEHRAKEFAQAIISDSEFLKKWSLSIDIELAQSITGKYKIYYLE